MPRTSAANKSRRSAVAKGGEARVQNKAKAEEEAKRVAAAGGGGAGGLTVSRFRGLSQKRRVGSPSVLCKQIRPVHKKARIPTSARLS